MSDQILDEDEVLKNSDAIGPSFWSDFKYFVWAFVIGMGMVYFLVNLFYFIQKLLNRKTLLGDSFFDIPFQTQAIAQAYIAFPFTFILMLVFTWYINRKSNEPKILKYIYAVFGMLIVHLLFISEWLSNLILVNSGGFLLGLILISLSIFMLTRVEK